MVPTTEAGLEAGDITPKYPINPEEAIWLAKAKKGDSAAFAKIVDAYQRPVFNLCYRMLADGGEAEDAAQESFIRAYMKLSSYDPERKFSSWLFSIASHYCIDRIRKRRMQMVSWDDLPPWRWLPTDDAPQPEEAMLEVEASKEIRALLNSLAPDYRAAVILKYWYDMPYEDIAQALDSTVSAIKSKLFRARKMMAGVATGSNSTLMSANGVALAPP